MRATVLLLMLFVFVPPNVRSAEDPHTTSKKLAQQILADPDLPLVLDKARALLKTGLTAGSGYGEVWIRDLNTFIDLSLQVNPPEQIRTALLTFFRFQLPNGDVPDGFIPKERGSVSYKYRRSELAPGLLAHKNTVETDQETSLVQAVRRYVTVTKDRTFLQEQVDGKTVLDRLELALEYLLNERFDSRHGLIWGATTADWGDVQPEHEWGVEFDASSHRAIDIYDNAMFVIALSDFLQLLGPASAKVERWTQIRDETRRNVRKYLWDKSRRKFIPHIYLAESPFPKDFDENAIYYHGGTSVAIEAGILTHDEIAQALQDMRANVRAAGASSIGLTVYPPYPKGFFKNTGMGPYSYQNGGDWCWFGARMIQQLIGNGFAEEAYVELKPMVSRVKMHGDFYEWWSLANEPRGSKQYRGSAGALGKAILLLQAWAGDLSAADSINARSTVTGESLAMLATQARPGFLLGSFASGLDPARAEAAPRAEFFRRNFNVMTAGVYMNAIQRTAGDIDFTRLDALIAFANTNKLKVYLHPLIGGEEYTPKWVNEGGFSPDALREIMRHRITTILNRYRGRIDYVDVVNESLTGTGRKPNGEFDWQVKAWKGGDHVWMKTLGMYQRHEHEFPAYLVEAFRIAREAAGPDVKLILNEWGNETTKSLRGKTFLELVQALRADGVPVDGVGLQMHSRIKDGVFCDWLGKPFDFEAFDAMLKLYEQNGIDVHITEFDIHLPSAPTPADFELQGKYYAEVLRHAIASPAVKSFKTWGFTDGSSWKADGQDGHPLLLDEKLQPKPAYLRQIEMLKRSAGN